MGRRGAGANIGGLESAWRSRLRGRLKYWYTPRPIFCLGCWEWDDGDMHLPKLEKMEGGGRERQRAGL